MDSSRASRTLGSLARGVPRSPGGFSLPVLFRRLIVIELKPHYFDAGAANPHGAENSAVKNTAPLSFTPLRISENASIQASGLSATSAGRRAMESDRRSRSSK